jgi:hypothetical protein
LAAIDTAWASVSPLPKCKEELPEIKDWLSKNYSTSVKSVSFLLYAGHGFDQAPYETVSKERFDALKSLVKPITSLSSLEEKSFDSGEDCATGACPIK